LVERIDVALVSIDLVSSVVGPASNRGLGQIYPSHSTSLVVISDTDPYPYFVREIYDAEVTVSESTSWTSGTMTVVRWVIVVR
jgi:hypothetical protein